MTRNKRYEHHYDALNDERSRQASPRPHTLPQQAYGGPLEWGKPVPVWAWVQWPDKPAERLPCFAVAWNPRVVVVKWYQEPGGAVDTVVWRNAVTRRSTGPAALG